MNHSGLVGDNGTIYLDYHATTPCDPKVIDVVHECLQKLYGNPSSQHSVGKSAKVRLKEARKSIANSIGARPGEVIFTGGATESNNTAIIGLTQGDHGQDEYRDRILTSAIEHKSVSKAASSTEGRGFRHDRIPVDAKGWVDPNTVSSLLDEETLLVSVQAANNEIGTVQPVQEIAALAHEYGAYFHCDAAQALGRIDVDVTDWGADLVSFSAHKAYGPKGIGLLYIDGGPSSLPVAPILHGGGQERGIRPGTVNLPNVAGFAEACRIIDEMFARETERLRALRDRLEQGIVSKIDRARVIGAGGERLVSTTNIHFEGIEAEALLARTPNIALSTGSACEAGAPEPSHVLQAVGLRRDEAYECVRFSVGRFTTENEIEKAVSIICDKVDNIRAVV